MSIHSSKRVQQSFAHYISSILLCADFLVQRETSRAMYLAIVDSNALNCFLSCAYKRLLSFYFTRAVLDLPVALLQALV